MDRVLFHGRLIRQVQSDGAVTHLPAINQKHSHDLYQYSVSYQPRDYERRV